MDNFSEDFRQFESRDFLEPETICLCQDDSVGVLGDAHFGENTLNLQDIQIVMDSIIENDVTTLVLNGDMLDMFIVNGQPRWVFPYDVKQSSHYSIDASRKIQILLEEYSGSMFFDVLTELQSNKNFKLQRVIIHPGNHEYAVKQFHDVMADNYPSFEMVLHTDVKTVTGESIARISHTDEYPELKPFHQKVDHFVSRFEKYVGTRLPRSYPNTGMRAVSAIKSRLRKHIIANPQNSLRLQKKLSMNLFSSYEIALKNFERLGATIGAHIHIPITIMSKDKVIYANPGKLERNGGEIAWGIVVVNGKKEIQNISIGAAQEVIPLIFDEQ